MSVLNMPSSRSLPEAELERITEIAVSLSGQLTRVHFDELDAAIAGGLLHLVEATGADACRLIQFNDSGAVVGTQNPTRIVNTTAEEPLPLEDWFVVRLARGEVVALRRRVLLPPRAENSPGALGLPLRVVHADDDLHPEGLAEYHDL